MLPSSWAGSPPPALSQAVLEAGPESLILCSPGVAPSPLISLTTTAGAPSLLPPQSPWSLNHTFTPSPISHPHNSAGYTITKPSDLPPLSAEPRFLSITGVIISATLPSEYTSDQHNLSHTHNIIYCSTNLYTSIHPYIYSICDLYSMQ